MVSPDQHWLFINDIPGWHLHEFEIDCWCMDGANVRPPEDIGGALGYEDFLAT